MRSKVLVAVVAGVVLLAACGGGTQGAGADGSDTTAGDTATTAAPPASTTTVGAAPTTGDSGSTAPGPAASGGAATATVTIGDTTYEFTDDTGTWTCGSLGGMIYGTWATDVSGAPLLAGSADAEHTLIFTVGPPDWEEQGMQEPSVAVQVASEGAQWWAGAVPQVSEESRLESWTTGDGHAAGEATFVDVGAYGRDGTDDLVPGTFDITCP